MSNNADIAIGPANLLDPNKPQGKIIPVYLLTLDEGKKNSYFVAIKYDEHPQTAKVVGFFYDLSIKELMTKFDQIVKNMPAENFVEIMFPWAKIKSVQNLIYRYKVQANANK